MTELTTMCTRSSPVIVYETTHFNLWPLPLIFPMVWIRGYIIVYKKYLLAGIAIYFIIESERSEVESFAAVCLFLGKQIWSLYDYCLKNIFSRNWKINIGSVASKAYEIKFFLSW